MVGKRRSLFYPENNEELDYFDQYPPLYIHKQKQTQKQRLTRKQARQRRLRRFQKWLQSRSTKIDQYYFFRPDVTIIEVYNYVKNYLLIGDNYKIPKEKTENATKQENPKG